MFFNVKYVLSWTANKASGKKKHWRKTFTSSQSITVIVWGPIIGVYTVSLITESWNFIEIIQSMLSTFMTEGAYGLII